MDIKVECAFVTSYVHSFNVLVHIVGNVGDHGISFSILVQSQVVRLLNFIDLQISKESKRHVDFVYLKFIEMGSAKSPANRWFIHVG